MQPQGSSRLSPNHGGLRDLKASVLPFGAGLERFCPPGSHQKERTFISSRALLSSFLTLIPSDVKHLQRLPAGELGGAPQLPMVEQGNCPLPVAELCGEAGKALHGLDLL